MLAESLAWHPLSPSAFCLVAAPASGMDFVVRLSRDINRTVAVHATTPGRPRIRPTITDAFTGRYGRRRGPSFFVVALCCILLHPKRFEQDGQTAPTERQHRAYCILLNVTRTFKSRARRFQGSHQPGTRQCMFFPGSQGGSVTLTAQAKSLVATADVGLGLYHRRHMRPETKRGHRWLRFTQSPTPAQGDNT